jgi:hypothetical protein
LVIFISYWIRNIFYKMKTELKWIKKDLNALLFTSQGALVPNASQIVLKAFLNLSHPKVDSNVADFFKEPGMLL